MKTAWQLCAFTLGLFTLASCASKTTFSSADLKAPFIDNSREIESCYEKVSRKEPDLGTGKVELKFLINEEGRTYKTIFLKKRSTINSKLLNACLKKIVGGWQFPKGQKLEVIYPFQFENKAPLGTESLDIPEKNQELELIDNGGSEEEESLGDAEESSSDSLDETPSAEE